MLTGPSFGPQAGGPPRSIVVLLHGVGADGQDLIGLAPVLAQRLPSAFFISPDAPFPCDMAPYGRQWFSLQDRRPAAMLAGARRAAAQVDALLDALAARYAVPAARTAVVGFSQGTMMALQVTLRRREGLAAIVGYSGALVGPETLADEIATRPPVLLVHGDADDVIPVGALHAAVETLAAVDVPVQWMRRQGLGHGIDEVGLDAAGRFLAAMLPDR